MSVKKSKKGKIIGVIVVIVVLFIIIGASGKSTTAHATGKTSTSPAQVFKLGQSIQLGNYNITLDSINNTNKIESNGMAMSSTQNNFAIAKITLENTSNNSIQGFFVGGESNAFTLTTDNSNYKVDNNSTINANICYNTNTAANVILQGTQLSPHAKYTCYIAFTTPKAVKNGTLLVNMGNTTAKINL